MSIRKAVDPSAAKEAERPQPGSTRAGLPHAPRRAGKRNKAALPRSQNLDLQGREPKRGPRGVRT
jgi:hypothetical protein